MLLNIIVDVGIKESGLKEEEVKNNITSFARDLLIIGASEQEIALTLREVSYEV